MFSNHSTNETSKVAVEFIPSSNPSSQESVDDDVLLQMSEYDSPCDDFTLYKLPSLKCDVGKSTKYLKYMYVHVYEVINR